jgi:hypothetical protein
VFARDDLPNNDDDDEDEEEDDDAVSLLLPALRTSHTFTDAPVRKFALACGWRGGGGGGVLKE